MRQLDAVINVGHLLVKKVVIMLVFIEVMDGVYCQLIYWKAIYPAQQLKKAGSMEKNCTIG